MAVALVSLAAAVGASLWVVSRSGTDPIRTLRHLPGRAHLLALGAFGVDLLARGARVLLVARGLGLPLTLPGSVKAQLAGEALGAVTPSRVGADPAKIAVLRRYGLGVGSCGALLVGEMGAESGVLLALALVLLVGPGSPWMAAGLAAYAGVVSSVGIAAWWVSRTPGEEPPALWLRLGLGAGRWAALRRATREFRADTRRLRGLGPGTVVGVLAATVLHMAARVSILALLVLPLVAAGRMALPAEGWAPLLLRPFVVLYLTALLPPPGGGGGVEVAFAGVLGAVLPAAVLASVLVWWRVYTFYLGAVLGAGVLLVPGLRRARGGADGYEDHRAGAGGVPPASERRSSTPADTASSPERTGSFSEGRGAP